MTYSYFIMHEDEWLDLVDNNDNVIGKIRRSEVYAKNLSNFRVINAFVINSDGKLWIPRRTAHKRIFPLCLDMSAAGHVESGESYDEAFRRETREELNIDIHKNGFKLLTHASPHQNDVSAFMNLYLIYSDTAPHYNTDDFIEYFWLTPQELLARIDNGELHKSDLPKLVRLFQHTYRR